jgi:hypothetical protein
MGSRRTIDLDRPGALGPWYQVSPFAKTTRSLAPWMDRGPGDQAGRGPRHPRGRRGRSSDLAGWVPRFQGRAVTSGPFRHGDPDILVESCLGIKLVEEQRRTRKYGTQARPAPRSPGSQVPPGPSMTCPPVDQVGRSAMGDRVSRCHQHLGAAGTKLAVGPRST